MRFFRIPSIQGNSKIVAKNAFYAFIIKGVALAISFFSTPLFVKYFNNNEVLGVWYTMFAMLTWFLTFDLGIGNGIRNHLVKSFTNNDRIESRRIISSGLFAVGIVTLLLSLIGVILILKSNLNSVLNISENIISKDILTYSALMVFSSIMLRFFLTTISSIFYALQRSAINNFLSLCVSILQLLYILVFRFDNVEIALMNISYAYLFISNVPILVAGVVIFIKELKDCRPHYKYVKKANINQIMGIGFIFFICQIFYLVIANTNEFFISYLWSPSDTTDYTFYYKITMLLSMVVTLGLTPTWSMITKAYTEGNYQWISKFFSLTKKVGFGVLVFQFALIPFLQIIMNLWLGHGVLTVQYPIAIAFACFGTVFIYSSMLSTIVCGMAKMKLQAWCYGIGSLLKIATVFYIAQVSMYWPWTVWINSLILLFYSIIEHVNLSRYFQRLIRK